MAICGCAHWDWQNFKGAHFTVLADAQSGTYPDWVYSPRYYEEHVPFSNVTLTEFVGFTPAVVTWRLSFGCEHHYHAFIAFQGTTGDLTVLYGLQTLKGEDIALGPAGSGHTRLDSVLLKSVSRTTRFVGGEIECDATFQRAIDPTTREAV